MQHRVSPVKNRPYWVGFYGLIFVAFGMSGVEALRSQESAGSIAAIGFFIPAIVLLWPRMRVKDGFITLRNLRTQRIPTAKARRFRIRHDGLFFTTFQLDLGTGHAVPVWAMLTPKFKVGMDVRGTEERLRRLNIEISREGRAEV